MEDILYAIAKQEKIENVKIYFCDSSSKGDGYLSGVSAVELEGTNKKLNVIIKSSTSDRIVRQNLPIGECFVTEIYFYDKIVPLFKELFKKYNSIWNEVPICYKTAQGEYEELVVLENLKVDNYEVWDRMRPVDSKHAELVLKAYAKLHAASFALKHHNSKEFSDLAKGIGNTMFLWYKKGKLLEACKVLCSKFKESIHERDHLKKYEKFSDEIENFLLNPCSIEDKYAVFLHQDCWINNMMFKYEVINGVKEPSFIKLIDFQVTRCASIIFDISHFLCTCADEHIWENLDQYLKIYHDTLSNLLQKFGLRENEIITFETLKKEFKEKCKFGLVMSSFFIKVMLMESAEAPGIQDSSNFAKAFLKDISNQEIYESRFKYLMKYFYEHDFY